eukprot:TRINITY_DN1163_c0_g1_i1.p1 TRINITY_DN1163_c0_g1~~TRINITY_DN1163_c0_g1_i1.p1  ORF type:complete len:285 (+),score=23.14 TRINITY_DN1163_c0_g1_i1:50-856(+)
MSELCTFASHGRNFIVQDIFHCYTCRLTEDKNKGCCTKCSQTCHSGHDIRFFKKASFFCDCGSGDAVVPCRVLLPVSVTDQECCSYKVSGDRYIEQDMYSCYSCSLIGNLGCCRVCAVTCHRGHDVRFVKHTTEFYCDCPSKGRCIAMNPRMGSYPSGMGHSTSSPGYPSTNPNYPTSNPSYPSNPSYQPSNPGYPPSNPSYPSGYPPSNPSNPGYPPSNPSYPPSNPSYPPHQPGNYPPSNPSNPPRYPSYPSNQGYPPSNPSYPPR